MRHAQRIALVGQLGTGKSHLARQLGEDLGAQLASFGGSVYRVAEAAIGRPIDKSISADRQLLVDVGTHWGRRGEPIDPTIERALQSIWSFPHGYPEVWVDALDRDLAKLASEKPVILDDLRFPNELNYLLTHNFLVLLVRCRSLTRSARLQVRGDPYALNGDTHESERFASWLTHRAETTFDVPSVWNDTPPGPVGPAPVLTLDELRDALRHPSDWCKLCDEALPRWQQILGEYK